jgi:hypothetical protein
MTGGAEAVLQDGAGASEGSSQFDSGLVIANALVSMQHQSTDAARRGLCAAADL